MKFTPDKSQKGISQIELHGSDMDMPWIEVRYGPPRAGVFEDDQRFDFPPLREETAGKVDAALDQ